MSEILIRAEHIGKSYGDGERVVRVFAELDLVVRRRERVAIIGESGVGKSTLLHILGTLDRPSEGKAGTPACVAAQSRDRLYFSVSPSNAGLYRFRERDDADPRCWCELGRRAKTGD